MSRATACFSMYSDMSKRGTRCRGAAQLPGELGFADAGRPGEQEAAGRLVRLAEPGAGALD